MPGVTITGNYGAGGSSVAPAVAEALGYQLLDRAISADIAAQLHVSVAEAQSAVVKRSLIDKFFGSLAPLSTGLLGAGTDAAPPDSQFWPTLDDADVFREQADKIMRAALASGAVIHGRGGAAAFPDTPDVLHVRLFGPVEARIAQGARLEHVSLDAARKAQPEVDRARAHYVQRLYNRPIDDPDLYELQIDSTVIPLDECAKLIVAAYRSMSDR